MELHATAAGVAKPISTLTEFNYCVMSLISGDNMIV